MLCENVRKSLRHKNPQGSSQQLLSETCAVTQTAMLGRMPKLLPAPQPKHELLMRLLRLLHPRLPLLSARGFVNGLWWVVDGTANYEVEAASLQR